MASWHHHANMKIGKVRNENLVEDEYHLLIACSEYCVIREKNDDLLNRHDNVSGILKFPLRRVTTFVHTLFSH